MTSHFTVREHKFPACHIREYAGSTANSQEEILHLHLKQYIPLHADPNPPADAVTVIATHGVGLPKARYSLDSQYKSGSVALTKSSGTLRTTMG